MAVSGRDGRQERKWEQRDGGVTTTLPTRFSGFRARKIAQRVKLSLCHFHLQNPLFKGAGAVVHACNPRTRGAGAVVHACNPRTRGADAVVHPCNPSSWEAKGPHKTLSLN